MSHRHDAPIEKVFHVGLVLNLGFTAIELTVGIITGSLALIADGIHNLTDSLTLVIALIAEKISKRVPDARRSYGYSRAKVIASLFNSGILVVIALVIGYEAIRRFGEPSSISGSAVIVVALVGIFINGYMAHLLRREKHSLNARSAYINMLFDTLSSVGALLTGIAIALFEWQWLDSLVGVGIALMHLFVTFGILKEALHILLEGVPPHIDTRQVVDSLLNIKGIIGVDDIHSWIIDSGYYAFSCHLILSKDYLQAGRATVEEAKQLLQSKYKFGHSTIEIEFDRCEPEHVETK